MYGAIYASKYDSRKILTLYVEKFVVVCCDEIF